MRKAVVVAGAPWLWRPVFVEIVRAAELVLAADGGANHLARIGVRPDAVVGDLDSILPEVRAWVGGERLVPRPDQDATDLHKTLAYAFEEREATEVTVLAATAGRLDHAIENLALLARWAERGTLELRDERHRIVPVMGTGRFACAPGQEVSLLPLGRCARVWTRGLHWELAGEPLDLLRRTSVSNVVDAEGFDVRVDDGALLVFISEPVAD